MKRIRTKIYKKILAVILISIVCCVLATGGFVYFYMKSIVENSLIEKKRNIVRNMCTQEMNILEEIITYAKNITFDDNIQEFFRNIPPKNSYEYYSRILDMERKTKEYKMLYGNLIRDIFVVDEDGEALELVNTYGILTRQDPLRQYVGKDSNSGFTTEFTLDYYYVTGKKHMVAYVSNIFDKSRVGRERGKLVILLDTDNIYSRLIADDDVKIQLITSEGVVLFDNLDIKGDPEYLYTDTIGKNEWKITYMIDDKDMSESIGHMSYLIVGTIAVFLCVALSVTMWLLMRLISPLDTLIRGMQRVSEGSRQEYIEINTGDECGEAANVFNEMVKSIDSHTKQLVNSEKKQFELQIRMLLYQLNPHFIYNTLNAIICLARKQDCEDIIELTRAFIILLRSLLKTDIQAMTTIEKEKESIDNYLHVLQMCYRNVPDITWEIEEGLGDREIPGMILYPLVENSIFHGIIPAEKECWLKITMEEKDEKIHVTVKDNGMGCSEEVLQEIRCRLKTGEAKGHVGLFNVNERLRLIYGAYVPLVIESVQGEGTTVEFAVLDKNNIRKDNKM